MRVSSALSADVAVERRLARNALCLALRRDRAVVAALRQAPEAQAVLAQAHNRLPLVDPLQIADQAKAQPLQPLPPYPAHAPQKRYALRRKPGFRFVARKRGETARLHKIGGELRQKLAIAQADRDRDADLGLDAAGEADERLRRARSVRLLAAVEVEKGLVDRQRLDEGRETHHPRPDFAPDPGIFGHVGRQDHCIRTQSPGSRHRHRRAHAKGSGDVTAGGDHAARPRAADDQRLVVEARIVALLDRGVEGVAVDMGDGEAGGVVKIDRARRAAMRASGCTAGIPAQTVAAEPQPGRIHPRFTPRSGRGARHAPGRPPRVSGRRRRRRRAKAARRRRDSRAPS